MFCLIFPANIPDLFRLGRRLSYALPRAHDGPSDTSSAHKKGCWSPSSPNVAKEAPMKPTAFYLQSGRLIYCDQSEKSYSALS